MRTKTMQRYSSTWGKIYVEHGPVPPPPTVSCHQGQILPMELHPSAILPSNHTSLDSFMKCEPHKTTDFLADWKCVLCSNAAVAQKLCFWVLSNFGYVQPILLMQGHSVLALIKRTENCTVHRLLPYRTLRTLRREVGHNLSTMDTIRGPKCSFSYSAIIHVWPLNKGRRAYPHGWLLFRGFTVGGNVHHKYKV